jgi:DNA-binding transcriptional LysR family regulator
VTLVPPGLALMEGLPSVSIQIVERSDEQLTQLLRRGEIEMAIVTTGVEPCPPDLDEQSIARDPFSLVVGRAHSALGPTVSLAEVADRKWVLPRAQGGFHRQIQALFLAAGAPLPANVVRSDSLLVSKEIVRRGERMTLLPRGVVAAELRMGTLRAIRVSEAEMSRQVGIRTLAGSPLSDLAEQFRSGLQQLQGHTGTL